MATALSNIGSKTRSGETVWAAPADQSAQQVLMLSGEAIPPGIYTAVYRVNGAQSKQAFQIDMA
jgi:hypothetical protein